LVVVNEVYSLGLLCVVWYMKTVISVSL